ncbi:MAG TPA: tetratricopeptide repeat protein [Anaerolineales bacterium]|nr:tetratricopeptide repeat protein [Anaerolineales bacterium]
MPGHIEKTVFISYRRTNSFMARAVYQSLTANGFDVFFDYEGINSGDFEQIILGNLRARAHFLVILTPSALERCNEPGDWLRREIETALDEKRNIVPLLFEGFSFSSPSISQYLTGKLSKLKNYNGLNVPSDYFNEAMERLTNRFLNIPLEGVLHPLSSYAKKGAEAQQAAANKTPEVKENELSAEEWLEQGNKHYFIAKNNDEAIYCYTEAIRLKPDFALAFWNRGHAHHVHSDKSKSDLEAAIKDYTEAIRLKPDFADAFHDRGFAHHGKDNLEAAIKDYNEAIRLKPDDADALTKRGNVRRAQGDLEAAIKDYNEAIRLKPDDADAFINRGLAHYDKGDLEAAIKDCNEAIRLKPGAAIAFNIRGLFYLQKKDFSNAIRDFEKALQIDPNFARAKSNLDFAHSIKR